VSKHGTFISVAENQEGAHPRIVGTGQPFPVYVQENNQIVNGYIHRHTATSTTLTVATNINDTSITVDSVVGFAVGDFLHIGETFLYTEPLHPQITDITGSVITLDGPVNNAYEIGTDIIEAVVDLSSAVGTLSSPATYIYRPRADNVEHIYRIILSMTHAAAADDSKFGGIAALTNGVVLRAYINGQYGTFTNWKANSDIISDMYDVAYTDKTGGGLNGTSARGSFIRVGVTIELRADRGDFLELLVQDDITALESFKIKAQGHVERYFTNA